MHHMPYSSIGHVMHTDAEVVATGQYSGHKVFMHHKPYTKKETQPMFLSARRKKSVISSHKSSVVVFVNVLASGQVDVMSRQNSCRVVCVNIRECGQVEVSRNTNLDCL